MVTDNERTALDLRSYHNRGAAPGEGRMIKIPDRINIMGHTYEISYDKTLGSEKDCAGEIRYRTQKIVLQPDVEGDPRHCENIEYSFFHELVHGILFNLNYPELRDDEAFVARFGRVLYQTLRDAEMLREVGG
jgi:hypothetical protein